MFQEIQYLTLWLVEKTNVTSEKQICHSSGERYQKQKENNKNRTKINTN